jgi:Type II secretion system (T2SS), protein E, N-terminal domain
MLPGGLGALPPSPPGAGGLPEKLRARAFWYGAAVSIDLGRRLIAAGLCAPDEVEAALFLSVARGVPFTRVLLDRGGITERVLEDELDRVGGLGLRQVAGAADLVARLPRAMCRRLAALPTRIDAATGVVDVAAADPLDVHVASEFGFHLGVPIRVLRAPIGAIEEAIRRLELDDTSAVVEQARPRRVTPPFPHGAPQSSIPPPVYDEAPIPLVRKASGHDGGSPNAALGSAPKTPGHEPGPTGAHEAASRPTPRPKTPVDGFPTRAGGTLVPPAGAPPLARLGVTAPRPYATTMPSPTTQSYPVASDAPRVAPTRAAPRYAGAAAEPAPSQPPAVSFPSIPAPPLEYGAEPRRSPAASTGDRITPPYGTPIYDPSGARRSTAPPPPRTARTTSIPPPPTSLDGYRIAPPAADESYALGRVSVSEEEPPQPPVVPFSPPPARPTLSSAQWPATTAPNPPAGPRRPARPSLADVPYPSAIRPQAPGQRRGALPDEEGRDDAQGPAPKRVRAPDAGPVLEALRQATSRDDVIRVAMKGMRLAARRIAVFAVKRDAFTGWACNVDLGDADELRDVKVPIEQPSVLATATATAIYLGPIPATPAHEGLLRVMDRASGDVAAVAVRVAGRPVLVLLCDELDDTLTGTRYLVELARSVGEALTRLLADR